MVLDFDKARVDKKSKEWDRHYNTAYIKHSDMHGAAIYADIMTGKNVRMIDRTFYEGLEMFDSQVLIARIYAMDKNGLEVFPREKYILEGYQKYRNISKAWDYSDMKMEKDTVIVNLKLFKNTRKIGRKRT